MGISYPTTKSFMKDFMKEISRIKLNSDCCVSMNPLPELSDTYDHKSIDFYRLKMGILLEMLAAVVYQVSYYFGNCITICLSNSPVTKFFMRPA